MSYERARDHLERLGYADRIQLFDVSSATVELAAAALGCEPGHIAKSLAFSVSDSPVMILAAGNVKIDNSKYKHFFGQKAKMLSYEDTELLTGHAVGGVCPFGVNDGVRVYADISLKNFDTVYPACGTSNSAVKFTPQELFEASLSIEWIDVCKPRD
ncbi:MAG: YbaK/EbsC family protein [Clostridia bacterium]|nr:YbaK/EbsC family protein [Clostridia bacterium]